jgi:hypothetical protein
VTTNFPQQQASDRNLNFSKSAPTPQHGQRPDREVLKRPEPRNVAPQQPGPH